MDPPYLNTKGMYYGGPEAEHFWNTLRDIKCWWLLSYNGIAEGSSTSQDSTAEIPREIYTEHVYIPSGNSSFRRLKNVDSACQVLESLYIKKF